MKIYKKILNFGYGICCLLPFVVLVFGFLYFMKTGENMNFDLTKFEELAHNMGNFLSGVLDTLYSSVEWFKPFETFNNWIALTFLDDTSLSGGIIGGMQYIYLGFVIYYAEWVVLVSFFRLFGSVFGCMINFADRMLDKIGGTN